MLIPTRRRARSCLAARCRSNCVLRPLFISFPMLQNLKILIWNVRGPNSKARRLAI
jgi:hypothetical protein